MIIGLCMVILEFQTGLMMSRLGVGGRVVSIVCGTGFSVWGLKELISNYWPRMSGRGFHFKLPLEGGLYLLIMIVLFIGALIGRSNLLMMVFAMMAGPFVINGKFTYTMLQRLHVRRELPERIMAGETFTAAMTLVNKKSWLSAWLMTLHDSVTHSAGYLTPEVLFIRVPPSDERRGHYQLRLLQRGRYEFGPVDVTTRFPLGLVERGVQTEVRDHLLVYPRIGHLRTGWRDHLQNSVELVSHVKPQSGPFNDDLYRIREYRPGDDTRMIHWRTSARMNELMVCDYKESRDRDLALVVDPWIPENATDEDRERVELALRFATTICMDQLHNSRESSLVVRILGETVRDWHGDTLDNHIESLLDAFAVIEASPIPAVEEFVLGLDQAPFRQGRMLIVTARPDAIAELLQRAEVKINGSILEASEQALARIYVEEA